MVNTTFQPPLRPWSVSEGSPQRDRAFLGIAVQATVTWFWLAKQRKSIQLPAKWNKTEQGKTCQQITKSNRILEGSWVRQSNGACPCLCDTWQYKSRTFLTGPEGHVFQMSFMSPIKVLNDLAHWHARLQIVNEQSLRCSLKPLDASLPDSAVPCTSWFEFLVYTDTSSQKPGGSQELIQNSSKD